MQHAESPYHPIPRNTFPPFRGSLPVLFSVFYPASRSAVQGSGLSPVTLSSSTYVIDGPGGLELASPASTLCWEMELQLGLVDPRVTSHPRSGARRGETS